MKAFFITGTDTGVGKTYFSEWLVRVWCRAGFHAAGLKPIACGGWEDSRRLAQASGVGWTPQRVTQFHFRMPAAPLQAAQVEGRQVDLRRVKKAICNESCGLDYLAVEGVGGWKVPLTHSKQVSDWAADLGFPVVVVARAGLGTLNHTLLTLESIRSSGAACAGLVINSHFGGREKTAQGNRKFLEKKSGVPVFYFDCRAMTRGTLPVWLC